MRDVIQPDWISPLTPLQLAEAEGHVDVSLRSHGGDAWRRDQVQCTVWSAELHGLPATIDVVAHKALMLARL